MNNYNCYVCMKKLKNGKEFVLFRYLDPNNKYHFKYLCVGEIEFLQLRPNQYRILVMNNANTKQGKDQENNS